MTFIIHDCGYTAIAEMVAGLPKKIDTIKVALDSDLDVHVPVGAESAASVPAHGSIEGTVVRFTGLVRSNDFDKWRQGSKITKATIYSENVPVATSLIVPPVEVASGAYITVSVDLAFGG